MCTHVPKAPAAQPLPDPTTQVGATSVSPSANEWMYNIPGLPAWSQIKQVGGEDKVINHDAVAAQMGMHYAGDRPQLPQRAHMLYALTPESAGQKTTQLLPLLGDARTGLNQAAGGFTDLTHPALMPLPTK